MADANEPRRPHTGRMSPSDQAEARGPETAQGRAMFEELIWVHSAIRRDLDRVEELAADVGDGLSGEAVREALDELKTNGPLGQLKVNCPDEVYSLATPDEPTADHLLGLFFSPSEESRAKGMESIQRLYSREADRDEPTDLGTRDAQLAAITAWGIPDASKLNRLAGITQPTFVANGENDTMMHTQNSQLLAEHLPNAELRIYPDAGHGFLNQYPEQFADDVRVFLDA